MTSLQRIIVMASVFGAAANAASESPDVDEVVRAWSARSEAIRTAEVSWVLATTQGTGLAEPEVNFEATHRLTVGERGERRYEIKGQQQHPEGGLVSINNVYTDDSNGNWRELTPDSDQAEFPIGFINEQSWGRRDLYPLLWVVGRSTSRSMSLRMEGLILVDQHYPLDDAELWQLEEPVRVEDDRFRRILVDPLHEFRMCRVEEFDLQQRLTSRWDISYVEGVHEWLPSTWSYTAFLEDGTIHRRKSARSIEAAVNPTIDVDTFVIEFPVGTVVYDERTREQFIQLANGERRRVTPDEQRAGISYSVAMRTKSGEAAGQNRTVEERQWRMLVLIINGAMVAFILGVVAWRKLRKSKPSTQTGPIDP